MGIDLAFLEIVRGAGVHGGLVHLRVIGPGEQDDRGFATGCGGFGEKFEAIFGPQLIIEEIDVMGIAGDRIQTRFVTGRPVDFEADLFDFQKHLARQKIVVLAIFNQKSPNGFH